VYYYINNTHIQCIHMYINAIMIPVETVPGIRGRRQEGKQWRK
jgi:hypothetical protein